MIKRFGTVGYLFAHWGIGVLIAAMVPDKQALQLGLGLTIVGNLLVALFKVYK